MLLPTLTREKRTELLGSPAYEHLLVRRYKYWDLYLNPDQRFLGRAYLWFSHGHQDLQDLFDLESWHRKALDMHMLEYRDAVRTLWNPDLFNYAWLGNEVHLHRGHAHMHLIPRYADVVHFAGMSFRDENWGRNYAPYNKFPLSRDSIETVRSALEKALPQ